MNARRITQLVRAHEVTEGAGVSIYRTLGTPARRHLDPFLMLDHFSSNDPDDYVAGFPDHPHRGFITLTYMLDGHMLHRDSMGNQGDLKSGGAQWMKAASGIIHSEMPQQSNGLMRGFQLWLNLPAAHKMDAPAYRDLTPQEIPTVRDGGAQLRVLAGRYGTQRGPIQDPLTGLSYFDINLGADSTITLTDGIDQETAFMYLFEGEVSVAGEAMPVHHFAVLGAGNRLELQAGSTGARLILVAGRPIGEPIVQHGPFVMNTREEIEQAFADYRDGRLVQQRAGAA